MESHSRDRDRPRRRRVLRLAAQSVGADACRASSMPRADADGQPGHAAPRRAPSGARSRGVPVRGSADTIFRFEARRTATVARWGLLLWWLAVLTGCASGPVTTDSRYVARFQLREGFVCV